MGYLATNGQCYETEIAAVSVTCNLWKNTFLTSAGNLQTEFCYNVYVPYVGSQTASIRLKNYVYSSNGIFVNFFQTAYSLDLLKCDVVASSGTSSASAAASSYRATPEEYQAVTVIFSAVLAALCVVWGFRQIIKIFATHPEA